VSTVVSQEAWKRRPKVRAEGYETSGAGFADQPTPRWHMWGEHVEEDKARMLQGLICIRCWQPFPVRLGPASANRIVRECGPFGRADHDAKALVRAGHCPYCAAEVSPEMAAVFFAGVKVRATTREEDEERTLLPGEHGEFERYIDRRSKGGVYLP
jgi:hypothetical protein